MSDAEAGFATTRFSYTTDHLKRLDELMELNGGKISAVVGIAMSEKMFKPEEAEQLVWMIENRKRLMNLPKDTYARTS